MRIQGLGLRVSRKKGIHTILGVSILRTIVIWDVNGVPYPWNYHFRDGLSF